MASSAASGGPTFHVVLVHPEIPPNTGNVIRQCAVTGSVLHLVEPVRFDMSDKRLRRAGLDYAEWTTVQRHESWAALTATDGFRQDRCFVFEARSARVYSEVDFAFGDWLVFGNEQSGVPDSVISQVPADQLVQLPMVPNRRSINLATSVGIGMYEAWRQIGFAGAAAPANPVP